jgi:NADPH2:quinone reductase
MRAARCLEYGPPAMLVTEEVPEPSAGPGQVVVAVAAAAVNFPDVLLVADRYQLHVPVPFTPGSELAGTVVAVGPGVAGLAEGDRVMGATLIGAFAERVAVPAAGLEKVPPGLGLGEAAAFGVAHHTAYHALRTVAGAGPGDWVLVLGAAGGVGLAAVELATVLGARVVAAASSEAKLDACREKGAVATVDYRREDLKARVKAITDGGAAAVVDPVGGALAEAALRATRWGGRFVSVGFASGEIPRIPLNLVLLKGVVLTGFTMEGLATYQPDDVARDRAELRQLLEAGRVVPRISARFPLTDASGALAEVAERRAVGKVLVEP